MHDLIKINAFEFSLTQEKVDELIIPFIPLADEYKTYIPKIENIKEESKNWITLDLVNKAKRVKLDIAKIRTTTWKIKDTEKKMYLQVGNVIQKWHNLIVSVIEEQEEELEKIVKFFENQEKERLDKLQKERVELLTPYIQEISDLIALCNMDQDKFDWFLLLRKSQFEEKKALEEKLEAERIEKARLEEIERIEKIKENARIEAEAKVLSDKIEAEIKAKADLERVEREKQEAIDKIKREQEEKEIAEKKQKEDLILKNQIDNERLKQETEYKKFISDNEGKFDKILKEDWKVVLYKKVAEFIIPNK